MLRQVGSDVLLSVVVKPNRPKSQLVGLRTSPGRAPADVVTELEVALRAPPVEGAANAELLAFLGKLLGIPKSRVELASGHASRHKVVRLSGAQSEEVRAALQVSPSGAMPSAPAGKRPK